MTAVPHRGTAAIPADTLVGCLLHHAAATPHRRYAHLTFRGTESEVTYANLLDDARRFAGLYRANGVVPGDIVLLFLRTDPRMYAAFFGAMLAGAIPSFMPCPSAKQDPDRYWRDHIALLARIVPRAVLTEPSFVPAIRESGMLGQHTALLTLDDPATPIAPETIARPTPKDIAVLQHSSGTTGLKKGVMLTHAAILAHAGALASSLAATADDIIATWLPVYHDMGLISSTVLPLVLGQRIIAMDPFEWSADPASFLHVIARHQATLAWMPNFAFDHIVNGAGDDTGFDLRSMRAFIDCSEPVFASTLTRFQARFAEAGVLPRMLQASYGMAEVVFVATQSFPSGPTSRLTIGMRALREERTARRPAEGEPEMTVVSNGPVLPGTTIKITDPDGNALPDGHVGEITIAGVSLFDGYFKQPEVTAAVLKEGWLRSRDEGFLWQGEVYVLGRLDDRIIVHGRNLYAAEIETVLARVPGMKPGRAVALGVESLATGSQDLVVVAETDCTGEEAAALRRSMKAAIVQAIGFPPREIRLVALGWLSKTTSGKINRGLNKTRYMEAART